MTESDIYEAVAAAHAPPEWACFRDVANATGWAGDRRADAVAMNLYPSRGLEIRGFEIKTSVSDLRRELSNPDKAELVAKYCNTWWLVVPKGLTDKSDVPLGWGIMEVGEKGLRTKRAAVPRGAGEVVPVSRPFVAALARAAQKEIERLRKDWIPLSSVEERMEKRYLAGVEAAPRESKFRIEELQHKVAGARPILSMLGIDIDSNAWDGGIDEASGKAAAEAISIGRALMQKYRGGAIHAREQIGYAVENLRKVQKILDDLLQGGRPPQADDGEGD